MMDELLKGLAERTVSNGFCAVCSRCGGCTKGHIHCRKCACVALAGAEKGSQ